MRHVPALSLLKTQTQHHLITHLSIVKQSQRRNYWVRHCCISLILLLSRQQTLQTRAQDPNQNRFSVEFKEKEEGGWAKLKWQVPASCRRNHSCCLCVTCNSRLEKISLFGSWPPPGDLQQVWWKPYFFFLDNLTWLIRGRNLPRAVN